jgi:hypothetical protein
MFVEIGSGYLQAAKCGGPSCEPGPCRRLLMSAFPEDADVDAFLLKPQGCSPDCLVEACCSR